MREYSEYAMRETGEREIEETGNEQAAKSFVLNYLNRLMLMKKLNQIAARFTKNPKVRFPGRSVKNAANAALSLVLKPILLMLLSASLVLILFGVYKAGDVLSKLTYHEVIYIVTSVSLTFSLLFCFIISALQLMKLVYAFIEPLPYGYIDYDNYSYHGKGTSKEQMKIIMFYGNIDQCSYPSCREDLVLVQHILCNDGCIPCPSSSGYDSRY